MDMTQTLNVPLVSVILFLLFPMLISVICLGLINRYMSNLFAGASSVTGKDST